jgi:hypothetical protein
VHQHWTAQNFEWFRAIWIECGELMDHYGYKWWKQQTPDLAQVRLEVVDIWHFGMSALFGEGQSHAAIAERICAALQGYQYQGQGVREATEALAAHALVERTFSVPLFWDLLHAVELDFATLYRQYIGKNVLNFFRQDHGYKDGSYRKLWRGREDNEYLLELLGQLDEAAADYPDQLYAALQRRYRETA